MIETIKVTRVTRISKDELFEFLKWKDVPMETSSLSAIIDIPYGYATELVITVTYDKE